MPHSSGREAADSDDWSLPTSETNRLPRYIVADNRSMNSRSSQISVGSIGGSTGVIDKGENFKGRTQAWWSVDEHMKPRGVLSAHQKLGMSLAARIFSQSEENWDLSESLADLYFEHNIIDKRSWSSLATFKPPSNLDEIDRHKWLSADTSHGFIRVFPPDSTSVSEVSSRLIPCSLAMEAHSICQAIGVPPNSLHVQFSGDIIRRLDPYEHPLVLQNEYLSKIGFYDVYRIQMEGLSSDLGYLIRFYSGKPYADGTSARTHLSANLDVRYGGVLQRWSKRLCTLTGTQLKIFKDKSENGTAQVIQLSNGMVEECRTKTHPHHLKLNTAASGPEKVIFLSFDTFTEYSKWLKKCKKAVAKLPCNADLSNCNLEFLPETLFINAQLGMLNLRHNALKNRPTEEDIYTIGWLEDLPRFQCLRSLNLADNNLESFPLSICEIPTLVELNLGCNKIENIPSQISNLANLQALHLHNNHLSSVPSEIVHLKKLVILVLAFNKFHQIPQCVAQLTDVRTSECETLIMAGNLINSLSSELITKLRHVKKVDLRMNNLTLAASETLYMNVLEQLTHLDLRMNNISELDLRCIKTLEYLNVERNQIHTLQLNGSQLKTVFVANNELQQFLVTPTPEWLELLDVSHNKLEKLPEWTADCFFLKRLNASHNRLQRLPQRIFTDAQRLRQLCADHNEIRQLPHDIANSVIEEINLHHNLIESLPQDFFRKLNKLKVLNLSANALSTLPALNDVEDLNKLHELYLTQNSLQDDCMEVIYGLRRLKVLHLAYNEISTLDDRFVKALDLLQELNISGNRIRTLPQEIVSMPELRLLRAHSNLLKSLPSLGESATLKVLDVACNKLLSISPSELATSTQLLTLDMQHTQFSIDQAQLEEAKKRKRITSIDSSGENRDLSKSMQSLHDNPAAFKIPRVCQLGFSETSGARNKLCIHVVHQVSYEHRDEALFCMFDGGRNSDVPRLLKKIIPSIMNEELAKCDRASVYLKYTFLQAHKKLKNSGQYLGASALVCHIRRATDSRKSFYINLANCGDIGAVLCRAGEPVVLSVSHTVIDEKEEASRIFRSDGIITEDNRVNGASITTRSLGNCYLYPHVIPDPHVIKKTVRPEDQFLIIANSSLWRFLSHKEAIEEIQYIANPVVAAKRLQDLAQGYGCKENLSILVLQFNCNLLSTAPSVVSMISTTPEHIGYSPGSPTSSRSSLPQHDSMTEINSTLSRNKKPPIPAPRFNVLNRSNQVTSNISLDSQSSLTVNPRAAAGSSSFNLLDEYENATNWFENVGNFDFEDAMFEEDVFPKEEKKPKTKVFSVPEDLVNETIAPGPILSDSASTLTASSEAVSVGPVQTHLPPLYSSDTRLLAYAESVGTLNGDDGRSLGYPRKLLHQSDTRLLHASQIELKSTNYFNRPPLSVTSLDEEADCETRDVLEPPPGYAGDRNQSNNSNSQKKRTENIQNSLQSPDGSYFSIVESDEDDEEDNLYENVLPSQFASLRQQMHGVVGDTTSTGMKKFVVTQKHKSGDSERDYGSALVKSSQLDGTGVKEFDTDIPHMSNNNNRTSEISLVKFDAGMPSNPVLASNVTVFIKPQISNSFKQQIKPSQVSRLDHMISTGSSAYGSGSFAASQESSIDTYL